MQTFLQKHTSLIDDLIFASKMTVLFGSCLIVFSFLSTTMLPFLWQVQLIARYVGLLLVILGLASWIFALYGLIKQNKG